MARAKTVALAGARLVTGTVGVLAAAALYSSIALVPWPSLTISAPVALVNPDASAQQRVCSGPLLATGVDPLQAQLAASLGPVRIASSAGEQRELQSGNPNAERDGAPVVLSAPAEAEGLAATESTELALENYAGLAAAACIEPVSEAWIVGGSTTLGRTAVLSLANPGEVTAVVRLELWGAAGPIDAPGLEGITVEPGESRDLPLAGFAVDERAPVIRLQSEGGLVAPVLQLSQISGLTPDGIELLTPTASPATSLTIPGVVVDATVREAERGEEDDGTATLRLLAPEADTEVTVLLQGENGTPDAEFSTGLSAGRVTDLSLAGLAPGSYSVSVRSPKPVVAAVGSALAAAEGIDLAWFAATEPLGPSSALAVPDAAPATLHLVNRSDSEVTIDLRGPSERAITLPARSSLAQPIEPGAWRLDGGSGVLASVSLQAPGRLASFVVPGPNAANGAIAVYTR